MPHTPDFSPSASQGKWAFRRDRAPLLLVLLVLAGAALLLTGVLLDASFRRALAQAPPPPPPPGDINGDGLLDVSDPVHLLSYLFQGGPPPAPCSTPPVEATTVLVVRHAERETQGADPCLTATGRETALRLRDRFLRAHLDAVFATRYCRTTETVTPLADAHSLQVQYAATDDGLVPAIKAMPPGSTVVLAGNSFNIPDFIRELGVTERVTVDGTEFDNLWVVHMGTGIVSSLVHLRY